MTPFKGTLKSIFEGLPSDRRVVRNMLRSNFSRRFWEENTGKDILQALRAAGRGIRTQDFYRLRKEVLSQPVGAQDIASVQPDSLLPKSWFRRDHGINMNSRFQYRFRVTVIDPQTGEGQEVTRAIASDELLTPSQAYALAQQYFPIGGETSGIYIGGMELYDLWEKPQ